MATEKRVTFNAEGEPVVTITITGWHDAFRFSWAMAHLQCDFSDVARRIGGSLKRRMGAARFKEFNAYFTETPMTWVRHETDEDREYAAALAGERASEVSE